MDAVLLSTLSSLCSFPSLSRERREVMGAQWYTCRALVGFSVAMVTHSDQNQVRGEVGTLSWLRWIHRETQSQRRRKQKKL